MMHASSCEAAQTARLRLKSGTCCRRGSEPHGPVAAAAVLSRLPASSGMAEPVYTIPPDGT